MRLSFKNFGLLETIVLLSITYVVAMLFWTASTRPAVEAGERLGYLPGDLSQKIDPYLV